MIPKLFGSNPAHCSGPSHGAEVHGEVHDISYYLKCMVGGVFACGLTHTAVVPIDIVKCRLQADPTKLKGMGDAYRALNANGKSWMTLGWLPTFIGYSFQGMAKYGFYEVFKDLYGGVAESFLGPEKAYSLRTLLYALSSASAEFFADILLCPFEAVKVRIQTSPEGAFPTTFGPAWSKISANEGFKGFYKGITPLWCRQIPYTIMKFVVFERTVEFIFKNILHATRDDYGKKFNLGITFLSGYIAGVICALVSHPADTLFTAYNKKQTQGAFMEEIKKIYHEMPAGGLWKGLAPRIVMIGTLTGFQWWLYDTWKTWWGLKPTGSTGPKK
ncbi:unnamed protein product [Blepharisma stoltei]|uniref:Uncharacterized protein n=1 Tax=Blepharisma stoltei TaxID=1481888 RepID=A0AAU9JYQ2_9CILI|nr:unnamed protein product [Blepharisma stoltei]